MDQNGAHRYERAMTNISHAYDVSRLLAKGCHRWMIEYLFRQIETELAKCKAREASRRVSADGQIISEAAIPTISSVIRLSRDCCCVFIKNSDEVGQAVSVGRYKGGHPNPEARNMEDIISLRSA